MAWKTLLFPPSTPQVVEAQACLLAVKLAVVLGWSYCLFEGDAKLLLTVASLLIGAFGN